MLSSVEEELGLSCYHHRKRRDWAYRVIIIGRGGIGPTVLSSVDQGLGLSCDHK